MAKAVFGFFTVTLLFIDKKSSLSYNENSTCHHKNLTGLQLSYTQKGPVYAMEKKRIGINEAQVEMLVAEDVYNNENQLIFPANARLTEKAITRMRFHSVPFIKIFIEDKAPEPVSVPRRPAFETVSAPAAIEESYFEKLRETDEYRTFNQNFTTVASDFEKELSRVIQNSVETDSNRLTAGVFKILNSCRTGIQVFDLLHCTRTYDEVVFAHSLNVALISAVLGSWLNFSDSDLEVLIKCGIYHDIGKLAIPRNIVEKAGPLTPEEYTVMKSHTMRGYNILKDLKLDRRVKLAAMMHHERSDGSGYPLSVKADQLDSMTKIVAIADVYEAMTAPRKYRKAKCPFEAVKIFESSGLSLYDTKYLMTFLEHITQCYMGYRVRLNDGTVGTIVYLNRQAYSKPMIKVGSEYIDLARTPGKFIAEIL